MSSNVKETNTPAKGIDQRIMKIVTDLMFLKPESFNFAQKEKTSPLIEAVSAGDTNTVINLIKQGAPFIDEKGNDALQIAIKYKHVEIVKKLFYFGADFDHLSLENSKTALIIATIVQSLDVMRLLLIIGVNPSRHDREGNSPLHYAAQLPNADASNLLIEYGANIIDRNAHNETPLHIAAKKGNFSIVKTLIEHGAYVNAVSDFGTPLTYAVNANSCEIVKFLVNNGANLYIPDYWNYTPLLLAAKNGSVKILEYMLTQYSSYDINRKYTVYI